MEKFDYFKQYFYLFDFKILLEINNLLKMTKWTYRTCLNQRNVYLGNNMVWLRTILAEN